MSPQNSIGSGAEYKPNNLTGSTEVKVSDDEKEEEDPDAVDEAVSISFYFKLFIFLLFLYFLLFDYFYMYTVDVFLFPYLKFCYVGILLVNFVYIYKFYTFFMTKDVILFSLCLP